MAVIKTTRGCPPAWHSSTSHSGK